MDAETVILTVEALKKQGASTAEIKQALEMLSKGEGSKGAKSLKTNLAQAASRAVKEAQSGPDYQRLFWHDKEKKAWWVTADGDENEQVDAIVGALEKVPGVKEVIAEAESSPEGEGWEEVEYKAMSAYAEGSGGALVPPPKWMGPKKRGKSVPRSPFHVKSAKPYGHVVNNAFRCPLCAEGAGAGGADPVSVEPYPGTQCLGCGQVYLGDREWGTRQELRERHA